MCVPKVIIKTTACTPCFAAYGSDEKLDKVISVVAVLESCPTVELPSLRPACTLVAAGLQHLNSCLIKLGRVAEVCGIAGEEVIKLRDMAVAVFNIIIVILPFHKLTEFTELVRSDIGNLSL